MKTGILLYNSLMIPMKKFNFILTKLSSSKRSLRYSFKIENEYGEECPIWKFLKLIELSRENYCAYITDFNVTLSYKGNYDYYGGDQLRPYFKNKKECMNFIKYLEGLVVMQTLIN